MFALKKLKFNVIVSYIGKYYKYILNVEVCVLLGRVGLNKNEFAMSKNNINSINTINKQVY